MFVSLNSTLPSMTSISVSRSALSGIVVTVVMFPTRISAIESSYPAFSSRMQSFVSRIFKFWSERFHTWTIAVFGDSAFDFSTLKETCRASSLALWILPISNPVPPILPHRMT